jgi:hypothetical protein
LNLPCWKEAPVVAQQLSPETRCAHAKYTLQVLKHTLEKEHADQEAQLAYEGYEPVRMEERGGRVLCDGCHTAIADVCYRCSDAVCGAEFCLACTRKIFGAVQPSAWARTLDRAVAEADAEEAGRARPPARFEADTAEALARCGLLPCEPLLKPDVVVPVGHESETYVHAVFKHKGLLKNLEQPPPPAAQPEPPPRAMRSMCPSEVHRGVHSSTTVDTAAPVAGTQRTAPVGTSSLNPAVLVMQRRYPRTFIPDILGIDEVKACRASAPGPRLHTGQQGQEPAPHPPCPWCADIAERTVADASGMRDVRLNPHLLKASSRGTPDDWIWTPHNSDVSFDSERPDEYTENLAHVKWHWCRRQFFIVRQLNPQLQWTPEELLPLLHATATTEGTAATAAAAATETEGSNDTLEVTICRNGKVKKCKPEEFVAGYKDILLGPLFADSQLGDLIKLKDWPPKQPFEEVAPRHHGALRRRGVRCVVCLC